MSYQYNPHRHVKIWLSNNRDVFMNFENQTRLIRIRDKNPKDTINLVYDSSLLNEHAIDELNEFCAENNIVAVDAHYFHPRFLAEPFRTFCQENNITPQDEPNYIAQFLSASTLQSEDEVSLYALYQEEIQNLQAGGNLGVASDILRWLSPVYRLGTYTDLDVQLDTAALPATIEVDAPLLLNIGSVKLGPKEMLIVLNEYVAIIDEQAAKEQIKKIHRGLLTKLRLYDTDYIESTEESFGTGFLSRTLIGFMKNRTEAIYIDKSNLPRITDERSSRQLRAYIHEVMSDQARYLDFNKHQVDETDDAIIQRLRKELASQLGIIKWLFFRKEYNEIKDILANNDEQFIAEMMKKERSLYLKSIVICTTGPIEVARSLFNTHVLNTDDINQVVRPYSFSYYDLHKAFLSNNVIPMHENAFGMLRLLGADVGELNDSSWLEEGIALQETRQQKLARYQTHLAHHLPRSLATMQVKIETHLYALNQAAQGFFSFFGKHTRENKIEELKNILTCFDKNEFNINDFRQLLTEIHCHKPSLFARIFYRHSQTLIEDLEHLCVEAIVYRLAKDKKITLSTKESAGVVETPDSSPIPVVDRPNPIKKPAVIDNIRGVTVFFQPPAVGQTLAAATEPSDVTMLSWPRG